MEKSNCLFHDCKNTPKVRGLCANHYAGARTLVNKGKITWEALEKKKKALLPRTGRVSLIEEWFLA